MASPIHKLLVVALLSSVAAVSAVRKPALPNQLWTPKHGPPHDEPSFINSLVIAGRYSKLVSLLKKTGLDEAIEKLSAFGVTLFAPTDEAFTKIQDTLNTLTEKQVELVLTYHVVGRYIPKDELLKLSSIEDTVSGCSFFVNSKNEGGAVIIFTGVVQSHVHAVLLNDDYTAVYGIDTVLIPGALSKGTTCKQIHNR